MLGTKLTGVMMENTRQDIFEEKAFTLRPKGGEKTSNMKGAGVEGCSRHRHTSGRNTASSRKWQIVNVTKAW